MACMRERSIDLGLLWVAEQEGKLAQATLPVISPGRTMLLFASAPGSKAGEATLGRLIDAACNAAAARDVHLAQALIDPSEEPMRRVYLGAGFDQMSELIYLQGTPHPDAAEPRVLPDFRWTHYSEASHAQFAATILATYQNSLDCPALNGRRTIEDIIDGHKASGIFNPQHWLLLCRGSQALGVLLLASSGRGQDVMELVYLGLAPGSRGQKLGEVLVRQAFSIVSAENHQRLSLAVDARNVPALKLYYRHGMTRVTSKMAFMRDLRKNFSPVH